MSNSQIYTDACERIRVLSEHVWEHRVRQPDIDRWLSNFDGSSNIPEEERDHAIHLLSHFNHFGLSEIRVLLVALYRDYVRYPILQSIRRSNGSTYDPTVIEPAFTEELRGTRFLGMGNPSESGSHLLYYFRQVNKLDKKLFCHQHELFDGPIGPEVLLAPGLKRVVFIDDVLGSGQQALEYSRTLLPSLRVAAKNSGVALEVVYCVLFGKPEGLAHARGQNSLFDEVRAVYTVDESELAFTGTSRVYAQGIAGLSRAWGEQMARKYGNPLYVGHPIGYRNGQMLLGLHHNVPDNTLPIFWSTANGWKPIFERFAKDL